MSCIDKALDVAIAAHQGQKYGVFPYMIHPITVVKEVTRHFPNVDEDTRIAAMLHDVVEDSETSFDDIRNEGFSEDVVEALVVLTRKTEETYAEYIDRILKSGNLIAQRVKYCDAFVNRYFDGGNTNPGLQSRYDWVMVMISDTIEINFQKPLCV
jgi:hypothetical protein